MPATVHASAVLLGAQAVLIRGPAGSGKSRLAFELLALEQHPRVQFARLIGDDRVLLEREHGRLLVNSAPELAGLIEMRGLGIRRLPHEPMAVVGLVVDLGVAAVERLPEAQALKTEIEGITLPRLAFAAGFQPLPVILAYLTAENGLK